MSSQRQICYSCLDENHSKNFNNSKLDLPHLNGTGSAYCVDHLTPPRIGPDFIGEEVTCVRPGREGSFNISAEKRGNQLIIHDYGHGGAGWTLVFGSVHRAINQFEEALSEDSELRSEPIAVIGGGAHGLLMAIQLKERGYSVRIVARDIDELASHKGSGIFAPGPLRRSSQDRQILAEVLAESFKSWSEVANGDHPYLKTGAETMPLYTRVGTDLGLDSLVDQGLIPTPESVLVDFDNGKRHRMVKYQSIFMDTRRVLEQLHLRIAQLEIPLKRGSVESFDKIPERVVFNCTGLGGGLLNQDQKVAPVQGHLITLKNQPDPKHLKYMVYFQIFRSKGEPEIDDFGNPIENVLYFTPKGGGTLGGTYIKGEGRLNTNHKQFQKVLDRSADFFGAGHPMAHL